MTIRFQCTECSKEYNVKDEMAGRKVRCGCGNAFAIPAANATEGQTAAGKVELTCPGCSRRYQAPPETAAKRPRCSCGSTLELSSAVSNSQPAVEDDPYGLGSAAVDPFDTGDMAGDPLGGSAGGSLFDDIPTAELAPAPTAQPAYAPPSNTDHLLGQAAREHKSKSSGGGINSGVLGGMGMIVIAVVWFVVGLSAGYIFFYPPVLLIIGIIAVVKGLIS